ncbi:hypothetical protein EWM64_g4831 [Hericium alpestre]|uniref:Fe2OG dioxygenase domain-containing protein n=1 Tax=Hericium alpestre TaxID=135208 RepID=A0A4Z0A067_9AGAM|nr:hypothetical protein EWM64_g4831 [Hericium alpestre]
MTISLVQAAQNADSMFSEIPIIDLQGLSNSDPAVQRALAAEVRHACINVGFFYVKNHGISETTLSHALDSMKTYFSLPTETKTEAWHLLTRHMCKAWLISLLSTTARYQEDAQLQRLQRGPHQQQRPLNRGDMHEGFEFGWEELNASKAANDPKRVNDGAMAGANVWPAAAPGFREAMLSYYHGAVALGKAMFPLFAMALDLSPDYFDDKTKTSAAIMRALHYPPQTGPADDRVIGIGAHSDYECFTILWQEPGIQALQVLNANNQWIDAPPIPGTLVINLGDQFAHWTNDVFKSTVHRAINRSGVERYSIPLFFGTDYDVPLEAIPSCISADRPAHYEVVTAGDYVKEKLKATYGH